MRPAFVAHDMLSSATYVWGTLPALPAQILPADYLFFCAGLNHGAKAKTDGEILRIRHNPPSVRKYYLPRKPNGPHGTP